MHPYYMGKREKLKKEMNGYLSLVSDELKELTGKTYDELSEEFWRYYDKNILENLPYIGGDKSSGTKNLTGAFAFVAMGAVLKDYGVDTETWGHITTIAYSRFFDKFPSFMKKIAGKVLKNSKLTNKMLKMKDKKNAENSKLNPGSFVTEVQEPTEEYPSIYHTKVCPLANFAKEFGYTEYMPYICNLDYVMFSAFDVPFYREKTCASGDGCCDFKLKKGAPIVPAWPCHAADPNDPLK